MRFNLQTILHNPEEGHYGDCWRTCIACLLDLEPNEVPHFALDGLLWDVLHHPGASPPWAVPWISEATLRNSSSCAAHLRNLMKVTFKKIN